MLNDSPCVEATMKKNCQADADDRTTLSSEQWRHYRQQNFWAEDVCRTGAGSCVVVYAPREKIPAGSKEITSCYVDAKL